MIGARLPRARAIYVSQTPKFLAPVKIGELVRVTELAEERQPATARWQCKVGDRMVLEGDAVVKVPRREPAQNARFTPRWPLQRSTGQPPRLAALW